MAPSQRASLRLDRSFSMVRLVAICLVILAANFSAQAQQCVGSSAATCAYVTDYNAREIFKAEYAPNSSVATLTKLFTFSSSTDRPEDLTVGPNGDLYVAITGANKIVQLHFGNSGLSQISSVNTVGNGPNAPNAAKPTGLRFSWDGALYFNSTSGVWKLAGNSLTQVAVYPNAVTNPGGIAFLVNGDLVFAADEKVYKAAAVAGLVGKISAVTGVAILQFSENVVGLASDDIDNIYAAHGNLVSRYSPPISANTQWTSASEWTFEAVDLPQHIEAVPDAVNGANCNTINDLVWVSSYQLSTSGTPINGKVWRLSHTKPPLTDTPGGACDADTFKTNTAVAIPTKVSGKFAPAIGMAVGASKRKLTKIYPNPLGTDPTAHTYNFGGFTHQLKNSLANSCAPGSTASVTEEQMSPSELLGIFAPELDAFPIALFGQQGWITTFKLDLPACFAPESDHFIAGYFATTVPSVVNIVGNTATFTELHGFYPTPGPVGGAPGDPGVWNRGSERLVLASQNVDSRYFICNFLTPLRDPVSNPDDPVQNTFNYGQNITFKFQLYRNANCTNLVSDQDAQSVVTVFSLAKLTGTFERELDVDASGNSIPVPPRFKYDARANQFLFTLDSGALNAVTGKTLFEATVSSDTPNGANGFAPHSIRFYIQQ